MTTFATVSHGTTAKVYPHGPKRSGTCLHQRQTIVPGHQQRHKIAAIGRLGTHIQQWQMQPYR
jgi:hypothetical protein